MIKYRPKWCIACKYYLPQRGASSHKCLNKDEVFLGESKIKCYAYTESKPSLAQGEIRHGDGFNYTFGESQAAVNLMGNILQQPEYQAIKRKVCRILAKQIEGMKSLMVIKNKVDREATIRMWHDKFVTIIVDLPEVVKSHTRCVETGWYRQLLKDSKKE